MLAAINSDDENHKFHVGTYTDMENTICAPTKANDLIPTNKLEGSHFDRYKKMRVLFVM